MIDNGPSPFPDFNEWDDPHFLQVLPDSVELDAAAGRQMEGFLDVSHFAFVHTETFGEGQNPEVPTYTVEPTAAGFRADYISTVSNYPRGLQASEPRGLSLAAALRSLAAVHRQAHGLLSRRRPARHPQCRCPVSARKTRVFVPIVRDFDKDAPLQATLDFNHQVFAEDKAMVEQQYPEDLPLTMSEEVHIRADLSSITYRKGLAALGLGRSYTA